MMARVVHRSRPPNLAGSAALMASMRTAALSMRQHRRALSTIINKPWKSLGFDFTQTRSMLRYNHKDGSWDDGEIQTSFELNIHPLSNALHYGQAIFEGLKAFHCSDGKVRVFNSNANAARLQNGAARLGMADVTTEMFNAALDRVITDNAEYVPPYGSGGAMYLRPNLFGHGAKMGLGPAPEVRAPRHSFLHPCGVWCAAECRRALNIAVCVCVCARARARRAISAVRLHHRRIARGRLLQGRSRGHRCGGRRGV